MGEKQLEVLKSKVEQGSLQQKIKNTYTDELIICLCGPIGVDLHNTASEFKEILDSKFSYETEIIKLSEYIKKHKSVAKFDPSSESKGKYYHRIIDAGNELRKEHGASILAELAINKIAQVREKSKDHPDDDFHSLRKCFIIDSIKNIEELELFNLVYGNIVYFVGVLSDIETRTNNLLQERLEQPEIFELIDRDSGEEFDHGQKVSKCLTESDIFIRLNITNRQILQDKISRFCSLIFETSIVTPTANEKAMYLAYAAAGNSACLSRQVGASVMSSQGDVLSVGWNDVPKYGGGVYYSEDKVNDSRCMHIEGGKCFNDEEKAIISDKLLGDLVDGGVISEFNKTKALQIIKKSKIKSLIEFSRAVHAEMHAIIKGAQKSGDKMINGKLFCTTYPCHNCARHIVLAGIKEVYFIEPYRKSLATKLHFDSIIEKDDGSDKVKFLHYDGISPKKYLHFFKNNKPRKDKTAGKMIRYSSRDQSPKQSVSLRAVPILEQMITQTLKEKRVVDVTE
ncbi:hypothetical protein DYD21_04045 [Rhodohalobacter sp. SW132]|uniref:anti-phage dCTP deaminase n=1 Tax=Rhodohalobacter sp. SW132 TaxID=2293433 RepID=UPI000E265009|nr:anti-phage dCTP deaminase [Rhodohalobacter sp. SW132]REL39136.1 hypothetical protein DYD21_04045 [Rhodohalobacter sp. SW132]